MKEKNKLKVSAVVPTYNSEKYIAECIESLLKQTRKFDEIIVVDDGSTDRTVEIAKKYPVKLVRIKHSERSAARNKGIGLSKGDVIAVLESDCVYEKRWLEEMLKKINNYDALIGQLKVYKPSTIIERMNEEIFDARFRNYRPFSAWVFKRSVLENVGLYDEKLNAAEDVDLGNRVIKRGYKIGYVKNAIWYHKGEPDTLSKIIKRSWWFGNHMLPYYKKWPKKIPFPKLFIFSSYLLSFLLFLTPLCKIPIFYTVFLLVLFTIKHILTGIRKYLPLAVIVSIISGIAFTVGIYFSIFKFIYNQRARGRKAF